MQPTSALPTRRGNMHNHHTTHAQSIRQLDRPLLPPLLLLLLIACACALTPLAVAAQPQPQPHAAVVSPSLFAAVDPLAGFDHNCTTIDINTANASAVADLDAFQPCRSVGTALQLLTVGFSGNGSAWLQLLPGIHAMGSLDSGETMSLMLANSSPPSLPAALVEALAARSASAAIASSIGNSSVIDCSGHLSCMRSGGNATLALSGLWVTGSQAHALLHTGEGAIQLDGCTFDSLGAVLLKNGGSVSAIGSTFSNVRSNHTALVAAGVPEAGLLQLNNSHLSLVDSVLRDCLLSGQMVVHRGGAISVTSGVFVRVVIQRTFFLRNELHNDPRTNGAAAMIGGAALQIWSDYVATEVRDSVFRGNVVRTFMGHGGAVAAWYRVANPALQTSFLFEGCTFEDNRSVRPVDGSRAALCRTSTAPLTCSGDGGAIAVGSTDPSKLSLFMRGPSLSIASCTFTNNTAQGGGAVRAASVFSLHITDTNFTGNIAGQRGGGAITLTTLQDVPPITPWGPFRMDRVRFEHNVVTGPASGGAIVVSALYGTSATQL